MSHGFIGVLLGVAVGACCRFFGIPSPAPPHLTGAAILVAMTLGFLAAGWLGVAP
ncbi:MAG TPA: DUF1427 family protein [Acetobacteraceae bacterium]|nr:DUF1427 family protein [Acetobacteraceae bacterium]